MLRFALVLHAHLPWVREHERWTMAERWLHEALWECYLPLLDLLDELASERARALVTVSVSPPLAAMLRDGELGRRFEAHLDALRQLNDAQPRQGELAAAVDHHAQRLEAAHDRWRRLDGDLLGALRAHKREGHIELMTSAVSHAYLPGLAILPGAAEAQLSLGRASFARLVGVEPDGVWLPECGYDEAVDLAVACSGYQHTVVDAHAITFSRPRVPSGSAVVSPNGVVCIPRDRGTARLVWSRTDGYPGHPYYREFYRDLGFDLPAEQLGPLGAGAMTGLKYHRITARGGARKEPYDPEAAQRQADDHAADFVAQLEARARAGESAVVAAYDAELFGHWWFEGPRFLRSLLRGVGASELLSPTSPSRLARARLPLAQPAASSWGRGGFGQVWLSERAAPSWRPLHAAHRRIALLARRGVEGTMRQAALDQAVRELLLAEASDWLFMIDGEDLADYGQQRLHGHLDRAAALAAIARGEREPTAAEASELAAPPEGFLGELRGEELCAPLGRLSCCPALPTD
jgi:1,4-alpha-glucan branching enzyme